MKSPSFTALCFTLLTSFVALAGCSHTTPVADKAPPVMHLATAKASMQQIPSGVEIAGTVHAKETAALAAQMVGRVTAVLVQEGEPVRPGQVLVRLEDAGARAALTGAEASRSASEKQVEVAKSQAALAASTLGRYQMLRERKSVSPQEYDEVERRSQAAMAGLEAATAQLSAAQAAVTSARVTAGYATIVAPFAGVITARHADPGALASPGMPLLDVERSGPLQLQVTVDESALHDVQTGTSISVRVPAVQAEPLRGRIAELVPAADPTSHTFLVKADLPVTAKLHSGMYGTALLGAGTRSALMLPNAAVIRHGSLNTVWVVDERGIASLRYVTLGAGIGQDTEALSGLKAGEEVVLAAGDRELSGVQIATTGREGQQ